MPIFDKFSKELISKYKTKSLFFEYFIHILLTVTIPVLMLIFVITLLFTSTYKSQKNDYIRSVAEKNAGYIDNVFSQVNTYYKSCLTNEVFSALLKNDLTINNAVGYTSPYYSAVKESEFLDNYLQCIGSIYLYSFNKDYVFGIYGTSSDTLDRYTNKSWYDEYISQGKSDYVSTLNYKGTDYLTFCYNIGNQRKNPGLLVITVNESLLINKLSITDSNSEAFKIVSNVTGKTLMNFSFNDASDKNVYEVMLENFPATFVYSSDNKYPFPVTYNLLIVLACALIFVLLSVMLAYSFSKKQYLSILSVITSIENPNVQDNIPDKNELYYLIQKTKSIAGEKISIENELTEKVAHLKKAQAIALQTQITPHFLFNTLNMITYSILDYSKEDTPSVKMIALLSDILRYFLKTEEYIVTVESEIKVLKSYIEILEIKYQNSFTVNWNISEDILKEKTLKSTIQPLVENAVEHGIKKLFMKKPGIVSINIYKYQNCLYINVEDNGAGMSADELDSLTSTLDSEFLFRNNNIGLKNVVDRIKLLFNNKGGYKITSTPDKTSVTIYHPII